jgi:hypothetical protein
MLAIPYSSLMVLKLHANDFITLISIDLVFVRRDRDCIRETALLMTTTKSFMDITVLFLA